MSTIPFPLPLGDAEAALRRSFPSAGDALESCLMLLQQQHLSLAQDRPPADVGDAVRLAAAARFKAREVVIPRERHPIEAERAALLLRRLARAVLADSREMEDAAEQLLAIALPRVFANDAAGVAGAAASLGLEVDQSLALLRECLKPELLRVSRPFTALAQALVGTARLCPLCGDRPACITRDNVACCRWCGLCWNFAAAGCLACLADVPRTLDAQSFLRGAVLVQCRNCGDVLATFDSPPDPLVLSLHGILAAPLVLAACLSGGATATGGYSLF